MPGADYFPLPITVEELTPQWLTAALRQRAPGATIRSCEVVDTVFTTCSKIRLRLDRDEAAVAAGIPELVIVKGGFEEHGRALYHMHQREVLGYRDIYTQLPLPHPECYFADMDDERRQGIIIMEDLVARGVEFCHATRPQTFEAVARRLSVLAEFHALSWASPALASGGKWSTIPDFFEDLRGHFEMCTAPEYWQRLISAPRSLAASKRFHDRQWMIESWSRVVGYGRQLPYCVMHGDLHLGNFYVSRDGTPCFLDIMTARGPAMLEITYLISASVDIADRRCWEGALVGHYLNELSRHGVEPPPFDEAMRQYAMFLPYGLFVWISTESSHQPESVNTANAARVSAAMLDHNTIEVIAGL